MIKLTKRNFIVSTLILVLTVGCLLWIDSDSMVDVSSTVDTTIRVTVVDVSDNSAVHNATVDIGGTTQFYTDNNGLSPTIQVPVTDNIYDDAITEWYCVNIVVSKEGYASTIVVACVVNVGQLREITVYMYDYQDTLPYVCYVESPPDSYLSALIN